MKSLPTQDSTISSEELIPKIDLDADVSDGQVHIVAKVNVPCPPNLIWQHLTDYKNFSKQEPNIQQFKFLDHPNGGVRIEQIYRKQIGVLKANFRVVMDVEENRDEIVYHLVEGDFRSFKVRWCVDQASEETLCKTALVIHELWVRPPLLYPSPIVKQLLVRDTPKTLKNLYERFANAT